MIQICYTSLYLDRLEISCTALSIHFVAPVQECLEGLLDLN